MSTALMFHNRMASQAKRDEVLQRIGLFVSLASKNTKGGHMVNMQALSHFLFSLAATLARVVIAITSVSCLRAPIGAVIRQASTFPIPDLFTAWPVSASLPFSVAGNGTEEVFILRGIKCNPFHRLATPFAFCLHAILSAFFAAIDASATTRPSSGHCKLLPTFGANSLNGQSSWIVFRQLPWVRRMLVFPSAEATHRAKVMRRLGNLALFTVEGLAARFAQQLQRRFCSWRGAAPAPTMLRCATLGTKLPMCATKGRESFTAEWTYLRNAFPCIAAEQRAVTSRVGGKVRYSLSATVALGGDHFSFLPARL